MKKTLFVCLLLFVCTLIANSQTTPVIGLHKQLPSVYFIKNVDVVVEPGREIKNANILVREQIIEAVGTDIKAPKDAEIIDYTGYKVYPGFIEMFARLGQNAKYQPDPKGDDLTHWNSYINTERREDLFLHASQGELDAFRKAGFTSILTFGRLSFMIGPGTLILPNSKKFANKIVLKYEHGQYVNIPFHGLPSLKMASSYPSSYQGSISFFRQTMYDAIWHHSSKKGDFLGVNSPEINVSLDALSKSYYSKEPFFFETNVEWDYLRVDKLVKEFGLNYFVVGSGYEYRRIDEVKKINPRIILPVKAPYKPSTSSVYSFDEQYLRSLKHLKQYAQNAKQLKKENIEFALSTKNYQGPSVFLNNLRDVVEAGLSKQDALASLTTIPAKWLGVESIMGTLGKGKLANFFISDKDIFEKSAKIYESWVSGERFVFSARSNIGGKWKAILYTDNEKVDFDLDLKFNSGSLSGEYIYSEDSKGNLSMASINDDRFNFQMKDKNQLKLRVYGEMVNDELNGFGIDENGKRFDWSAKRVAVNKTKTPQVAKTESAEDADLNIVYPDGPYGWEEAYPKHKNILVKNASIWTAAEQGVLENADMLVVDGKIAKIGQNLKVPKNANVIDATGKHLSPGIIDAHSHIAVDGGINEVSFSVMSEVSIKDVINPDDLNIYYQLAGGLTTTCLLHGSSNPVGGLSAVVKLKWGHCPDEMLMNDAPDIMKFAMGENVKGGSHSKSKYPNSKMGVIEIIRDAFYAALDYRKEWEYYNHNVSKNPNLKQPRKILKYENLLGVLDGKTLIHCHAYRHDEMLAFMRMAEEFGITVKAFIHTVEGYKVAKELKEHGAGAIVFSDWFGYKMETNDGIPYNAPLLMENGVLTSIHSDNPDHARRLNYEAAKAMYYGNVSPEEAIKLATINAAKMLGIDDKVGSLEVGKDADFVIWSHSPLSSQSKCEQTWIDGVLYFDVDRDKELRERDQKLKVELIKQMN